jgi:GTP pyrophosphokinase
MSVPAIAVYTSPPGAVYAPPEHEASSRGSTPCAAVASPSPGSSHRHAAAAVGGLSCLFSPPSAAPRATAHEELGALWHDRSDEPAAGASIGVSCYSCPQPSSSPFKLRDHFHRIPVPLFHSPASSPASRSPSVSWLAGRERERLFSSIVRNALGSCIDYAPATSLPLGVAAAAAGVDAAELAFELDENLSDAEPSCEPYARDLLAGAQSRHRIFRDELVVKAFFEAERAHRGQVKYINPIPEDLLRSQAFISCSFSNPTCVLVKSLSDLWFGYM